jgi:hypothetical protein
MESVGVLRKNIIVFVVVPDGMDDEEFDDLIKSKYTEIESAVEAKLIQGGPLHGFDIDVRIED